MTQQEILQNNKLIAEFMGWRNTKYPNHPDRVYKEIDNNEFCRIVNHLEYHSSWDWLMPVVEKIFNLENTFCDEITQVRVDLFPININLLYNSVVEFIKWYNEQGRYTKVLS